MLAICFLLCPRCLITLKYGVMAVVLGHLMSGDGMKWEVTQNLLLVVQATPLQGHHLQLADQSIGHWPIQVRASGDPEAIEVRALLMLSTDVRAAEGLMVEDCQVDALAMVACCWSAAVRQLPQGAGRNKWSRWKRTGRESERADKCNKNGPSNDFGRHLKRQLHKSWNNHSHRKSEWKRGHKKYPIDI